MWKHLFKHRDVYHIESIVSYRYHKTDTNIISKWQINDTFKNTFYDDINKDRASSFLHQLENYGAWMLLYCMLSIPKGQKGKWEFFNGLVSYRYCFVSIGIVSYHKEIKGTHSDSNTRWQSQSHSQNGIIVRCYLLKIEYHAVGDTLCQPLLSYGSCLWPM